MDTRNRTRMNPEDRRRQLLHGATDAFTQRPYEAVSVRDIGDMLGVSEALIFRYFPTKASLYEAVLETALIAMQDAMDIADEDLPDGVPPSDHIRSMILAVLDHLEKLPVTVLISGAGHMEPAEARMLRERMRDDLTQRVQAVVKPNTSHRDAFALSGFVGFLEVSCQRWAAAGCPDEQRWSLVDAALGSLQGALGDWQRS